MTGQGNSKEKSRVIEAVGKALKKIPHPIRLLVCVSGGADSVALLHSLYTLGVEMEVANCNFHLRGEESDRDSLFVAELCKRFDLPLHQLDFDTQTYCLQHHLSEEMACRELRYSAFRRLKKELNCSRIVVAHNADDNIETFLLNLLRGSGLKGLCAMREDTGEILRPLLSVSRREIEAYLSENDLAYVIDSSNLNDTYRRNFLRLNVLPLLETQWPGARKAISITIENLNQSEAICRKVFHDILSKDSDFVSFGQLESFPSKRELLFQAFSDKGATPTQIREMEEANKVGARWLLPEGEIHMLVDGFHYFSHKENRMSNDFFIEEEMLLTPTIFDKITNGTTGNNEVWLPGRLCRYEWVAIERGMRFSPMGLPGSKKITDLLRDTHIPPTERQAYPLLREKKSGEIIWVPGIRRSRFAKVNGDEAMVSHIVIRKKSKLIPSNDD